MVSLRHYILSEKNEVYRKAPSQGKVPSTKFEPEKSKLQNINVAHFMMIICESPIKVLVADIYLNYIENSPVRTSQRTASVSINTDQSVSVFCKIIYCEI